jgi:hypothetical protein
LNQLAPSSSLGTSYNKWLVLYQVLIAE